MMNAMTYKGYAARVEYDARDEVFVGWVTGIEDRVTFRGATVAQLRHDFRAAIERYLAVCAARKRVPQKPDSGKILLRVAQKKKRRKKGDGA